ncbi:MAG: DUF533 domain-containing protein, partial [Planctomycetaceae bacterium]|nr:DUF533 domain-containing protein [Planctomycetaceae bacterium]
LGGMLNSGAMGRIAQTMLGKKHGGFSWLKGALLAGAGSMLWKQLGERMQEANKANPKYNPPSRFSSDGAATDAATEQATARMIRALVYAAKADGHIDDNEKAQINEQIASQDLGPDAKTLLKAVMDESIDPSRVAVGVSDPEEALKLYTLSVAVANPDQFMEKAYLDALAQALNIPDDVWDQVNNHITQNRQNSTAGAY